MKTKPALLEDEFIDMKFIKRLTGLSDKWFYKLIQEGVFPKPIKMGRASRWLKSDLEEWLQAKINDSRN
ncbi:AlpA family phage regulatory protein [Citrobacter freundii]|uniref:AlpA family phage regulatory protein n=1 Tax=Citrobacter freundii TaxID=546 RepID=A0A7W3D2E6_CITFR|nr:MULTISPECIES: AlpA family phage regulatory protein [Citrobacter]EIP1109786.1 AlpA family phage regulatory protein [Citrobacter freundii]MBA8061771.1 AlpA family phage regulatory protein [Citrobacter freundii]MDM3399175.1 AlpA family phage regulatory protein [Citrobacter sp. Cb016]QLR81135.1 AlpA family phage regulatory protein [Citrobacter freundii]HCB1469169.1 AlpA family phage regulatory protein [Citrobacter freundii]